MRQVEEIESLKAENTKLQTIATQKEVLQAQLADKEKQLADVKNTIAALQTQHSDQHQKQLAAFTAQLRTLEEQRDRLSVELEQSQLSLQTVRREKELLEKNFKELVEKINQNDSVIGQLKEKIDVLGRQNAELAQANSVLSHHNQALGKTNVELTHRNAALTQHNATLTRRGQALEQEKDTLSQQITTLGQQARALGVQKQTLSVEVQKLTEEKQALTQNNAQLATQRTHLEKRAHVLEDKTKILSQENVQLRNQSAALLAARLVQKHAKQEAMQNGIKLAQPAPKGTLTPGESLRRPSAPVLHSLGRTISAAPTENEWEVIRAKHPVSISKSAQTVQSTDDLPEIKVAEPIPQDDLFNGEDFLEKTDSFIGRMKWSIFRENR